MYCVAYEQLTQKYEIYAMNRNFEVQRKNLMNSKSEIWFEVWDTFPCSILKVIEFGGMTDDTQVMSRLLSRWMTNPLPLTVFSFENSESAASKQKRKHQNINNAIIWN